MLIIQKISSGMSLMKNMLNQNSKKENQLRIIK
nr:MAG TPA: hypothetical protein [Bacteriophage sp.]